ncbi:MAG: response regulator transcription factor [Chromatiales bacterium]|nr:response regulator transcription factor [Chromatiales bacterium]
MRTSLRWLIESVGLSVETYNSAQEFLNAYTPDRSGCIVLDVRMPGMSGLELQEHLNSRRIMIPVIIVTGHGDIPMAVAAMKAGAVEFIEKPFNDQRLLDCVQEALQRDNRIRNDQVEKAAIDQRLDNLTPREREVMEMVVAGKANKVIAALLDVSAKTVEAHRAKVMEKMGVTSLAELVRLALIAGQEFEESATARRR